MTDVLQSAPAATDAKAKGAAGDGKKKKKLLPKLLIVVVLLAGGGYVAMGQLHHVHYKPGEKVPLGQLVSLDQLTVNLADGHLLQASIDMQLTAVASSTTITADTPVYDDAAIAVIGTQTYAGLLAPGGRAAFKAQLLAAFQKIAGTADGAQEVSAVYFTGLVIQ